MAWGGVYVGPASNLHITQKQISETRRYKNDSGKAVAYRSSIMSPIDLSFLLQSTHQSSSVVADLDSYSKGKVKCEVCRKKCKGDIFKADDKFFHINCFACHDCKKPLSESGYFVGSGHYYCPSDYHKRFGSKCSSCNKYIEGEAIQCMGRLFHQTCFKCDRCKKPFNDGQKATFTAREYLCSSCVSVPVAIVKPTQSNLIEGETMPSAPTSPVALASPTTCTACNQVIHAGQILLALDSQWHIWCFKCTTCGSVLHGEYMAKEGLPYCIRDYNAQFGVRCHECDHFIAGKVLQAGDYHFHPECALCSRCNCNFVESEEMYMQGDEIWHARCNDKILTDRIPSRCSTMPRYYSPRSLFGSLSSNSHSFPRSPRSYTPKYSCDFGKFLTYMYLLPEGNMCYLRQPVSPHPPQNPQFHMPQGNVVKLRRSRVSMFKSGLQRLAEILDEQQPRPRSPYMNNEEPIELSHFPSARIPEPHEIPAIEREDFPAPPYPYAVEELKRRLSSSDAENEAEEEDIVDGAAVQKIKKAEEELSKIENESSIAKAFVHTLEERMRYSKSPLYYDPRSASRTPSAKTLPHFKCRYESPINASPSRYLSRPRPWEYWDKNRTMATISYPCYTQVPKPGYGLSPKAASLPGYYYHDYHISDLDTTRSSTLSDKSNVQTPVYSEFDRFQPSYGAGVVRTSLPDMSKPLKIFPYDVIRTTNKKIPEDVDRCHLERHLTKDEFQSIFKMLPIEFYRLPEWKRINLKRLHKLY